MTPSTESYIGWRCPECGTVIAGQAAEDGDQVAEELVAEGQIPVGAIGCPVCPYQTMTRPVTVTVEPRVIA